MKNLYILKKNVHVFRVSYLLSLILLFLFEDVCKIYELLHGFNLPAQVFQVHATGPAVSLQKQPKPLAHGFIVHF